MKKRLCILLLAAAAFSALANGNRQDLSTAAGEYGEVRFHGRVYVSPCVLDMASRDQTVDLGDISARAFHQQGDRSRPVLVTLNLNDCLKGSGHLLRDLPGQERAVPEDAYRSVEQGISLTLMAEGAPENRDLGKIYGGVKGAGIRVLTDKGRLLAINQTEQMLILKPGNNAIHFQAALEATGREVSAGSFFGLIRIKLEYL
ncbi:fimbrial protein [uncultured Pluralibacter sp.]|uniref:fimbrial protein n=1 Tax=uncultured Pluralibacter sp. TaxID=1490864 RepID=UPI002614656E|nr:fimbrial protein [uncultured Pluralibacter sp.]